MRRLVRKLEQVGVAGVVIEDKLFPKTNSFLRSELQPLADIEEFCGKIKAGKDSQHDPDFVLVARVEALIAGWGLAEALKRAEAYHAAGADAILIHCRQSSPAEIFAFLAEWGEPLAGGARPHHVLAHLDRGLPRAPRQRGDLGQPPAAGRRSAPCRRRRAAFARTSRCSPSSRRSRRSTRSSGCRATPSWPRPSGAICRRARDRSRPSCWRPARARTSAALTARVPKAMLKVQGRPILARLLDDFAALRLPERRRRARPPRGGRRRAGRALRRQPGLRVDRRGVFAVARRGRRSAPGTLVAFGDIVLKRHIIQALLEEAGTGSRSPSTARSPAPPTPTASSPTAPTPAASASTRCGSAPSATPWRRPRATASGSGSCTWAATAPAGCGGHRARRAPTAASAPRRCSDLLARVLAAGHSVRVVYGRGGWVNVNDVAGLVDASGL